MGFRERREFARVFRPREIVRIDRAAGMGQSARRKRAIEKEQTGKTNAVDEAAVAAVEEEDEEEEGEGERRGGGGGKEKAKVQQEVIEERE